MPAPYIIQCKSVVMRKASDPDAESSYKTYQLCTMPIPAFVTPSGEQVVVERPSYELIPVEGGFKYGYNFAQDVDVYGMEIGDTRYAEYFCKNGNKLRVSLTKLAPKYDSDGRPMTGNAPYFNVNFNFYDYINIDNDGSGTIETVPSGTVAPPRAYIGSFIVSYNNWYHNGVGCVSSITTYWLKRETQPGYDHPDRAYWVTSGANRVVEEYTYEGYDIPTHIAFDIFLWAGAEGANPDDGDPYNPDEPSNPGGGDGDFDDDDDPIDFPDLPTVEVTDTGFITLFNPTLAELQNLADYMWSDLFDIDTFKKIFAEPMDCILGLSIVPVHIPDAVPQAVTVGNISTGVIMTKARHQYVELDCGQLKLPKYFGGYLDCSPYTKIELYLPYIGMKSMQADDIIDEKGNIKTIHIKYHVDILSGSLACFVKCGDSVVYTYNGQCSITIPVNSSNYTNMITSIAQGLVSVGSAIASGNPASMVESVASAVTSVDKPDISRSGNVTGMGGLLSIQYPYLVITRPNKCVPQGQIDFTGYPSFTTKKLSALKGYVEVDSIHLEGMSCTDAESKEIEGMLKGGVVF